MSARKNIIVTGGAGYIGSHTVVDLFKNGFNPIIIDNLCNSSIQNIIGIHKILEQKIKWHRIDCSNLDAMMNVFKNEKNIYGCIHFAAFKSVEESIKNPQKYFQNNVESLKVLLKCMDRFKIKNIIFSSSCTVYGTPDNLPVNESTPFKKSESPYSETKQICEKILESHNCSSISLRYFNPIGGHPSNLIGDCSSDKANNLVPIIVEVSKGIRDILVVNGDSYNTKDGTCIRDYIHVQDLASAHVKALDYLQNNKVSNTAFNVGTGKGLSVLNIIDEFEKVTNLKVNYIIGPKRLGDIEQIYADSTFVKKE